MSYSSPALKRLRELQKQYEGHADEDEFHLFYRTAFIDECIDSTAELSIVTQREVIACVQELTRQELSLELLELSLCPLHRVDYEICFSDERPECAAIRNCFPEHDT